MERVNFVLDELESINRAYDNPIDAIIRLREEIKEAKVCIPVIGKFSSGKSALINSLLGYNKKILKEDITPQTAIPTEIVYSSQDEIVTIIGNDNSIKTLSIEEYRKYQGDANKIKNIKIQLKNQFLHKIPDVMLVDMPGFESDCEAHNKAIDNYLPKSLAYLITFASDDLIVYDSIGKMLKELSLNDMPICIVVTKYDKRNVDYEQTLEALEKSLDRFLDNKEYDCCETSSKDNNVDSIKIYLEEIQECSQEILENKFKNIVFALLQDTENYLKTRLANSQLTESELGEKQDVLNKKLSNLDSNFLSEKESFESEIANCISEIKGDVQIAIEAEESTLVTMIMNQQSISEHLNYVIRNALTISLKKRFVSRVERYLKQVNKTLNSESFGDVPIAFHFDSSTATQGIVGGVVAVAAGAILGGPIGALIAGVISGIVLLISGDKKREDKKREIRMKLKNEVFPQILRDVEQNIKDSITKQLERINTSIEHELKHQRELLEKALSDVKEKENDEKRKKENLESEISKDLERIGELKDELR